MAKKILVSYLRVVSFARGGCGKCVVFPFTFREVFPSPNITAGFFFASSLPLLIKTIVSGEKPPTNLPLSMLYGATLLVAAVSCFIALLFLLFDIFNDHGKRMRQAYDFSAGLCQPGGQWSFICGKFVTRKRFRYAHLTLHITRKHPSH